jgi:hypothetical protein
MTEKSIDEKIARYLQCHLQSKSANPSNAQRVQVLVGGDHGDTAFQFGASVSVRLSDGNIIDFKVSAREFICRKDMGKLFEAMILPRLTSKLSVVAISPLHVYKDDQGIISCKFGPSTSKNTQYVVTTIPKVDLYVTGDFAFQAMVMGKESMSGHWCMQCTMQMQNTLAQTQLNGVKMWTMEELCRLGDEAEEQKGEPKLGVKKKPWWPFIPVTHYMIPLLHCEIGIGNQLLDMLRDIINKHLENMTRTKERT